MSHVYDMATGPQLGRSPPLDHEPGHSPPLIHAPSPLPPSPSPSIACTAPSPPTSPPPRLTRTTSAHGFHVEVWTTPDRGGARSAPPNLTPLHWDFGNPWIITDYDYPRIPMADGPASGVDVPLELPLPLSVEIVVPEDDDLAAAAAADTAPVASGMAPAFPAQSSDPTSSKKVDRKGKRERERELRRAAEDLMQAKAARRKEKRQKRELKAERKLNASQASDDQVPMSAGSVDEAHDHSTAADGTINDAVEYMEPVTMATVDTEPEEICQPASIQSPTASPPPPQAQIAGNPRPTAWWGENDIAAITSSIMGGGKATKQAVATVQGPSLLRLSKFIPPKQPPPDAEKTSCPTSTPVTNTSDVIAPSPIPASSTSTSANPASPALGLILSNSSTPADSQGQQPPAKVKSSKRSKSKANRKLRAALLADLEGTVTTELEDASSYWPQTIDDPAIALVLPDLRNRATFPTLRLLPSIDSDSANGALDGLLPNINFISAVPQSSRFESIETPELNLTSLSSSPQSSVVETPPPGSPAMSPVITPKARTFARVYSNAATYCSRSPTFTLSALSSPELSPCPSPVRAAYVSQPGCPQWWFSWAILRHLRRVRRRAHMCARVCPSALQPGMADILRCNWEGFIAKMSEDLRWTGSCQTLDTYWEALLVDVWEVEVTAARWNGEPVPTWERVVKAIMSEDRYGHVRD